MHLDTRLWETLTPVITWSGFVLICLVFGLWLLRMTRLMDEEEVPGRIACKNCG